MKVHLVQSILIFFLEIGAESVDTELLLIFIVETPSVPLQETR